MTSESKNMPTNEQNQPTTLDLQSDNSGQFIFTIDKNLTPGQHIITVEDEFGNSDDAVIYITEEPQPTPIIHKVTNIIPNNFFWGLLILFLIILVLIADVIRLARKADDPEDQTYESSHRYHFTINAILLCAILLIFVFIFGLYYNRETNFLRNIITNSSLLKNNSDVSGKIMDPITLQGVKGIDLVSQSTSIRTSESGNFSFSSVDPNVGIRATYPNLIRAFVFLPKKLTTVQQMDIIFNPDLYNTLVQVVDLESRGIFSDVYDYLVSDIKTKITQKRFEETNQTIYTASNVVDQEIFVVDTRLIDNYSAAKYAINFNKAVEISVKANNKIATYYFTYTSEGWRLIK